MINEFPQALSIAGSDSGAGAGMQADLKTMQMRHVFATTVLVAITAQNTLGVQDAMPLPKRIIDEQFASLNADLKIRACKTGMLADTETVETVVANLGQFDFGPLVVDPVMIAKGGAHLLTDEAISTVRTKLLPLADLVTPNLPEAEALAEITIKNNADMKKAGQQLQALGAKNVLVKGGHFNDQKQASDFVLLVDGSSFWMSSPRIDTKRTHGTGDTISACITAELAKGVSMENAIRIGKAYVEATIRDGIQVGQKDQRVEQVLAAVGNTMFVGYSCNQPAQIKHANQLPVAYVGSGPIFPTSSKNDADPAMGLEKLHELVTISTHPIVAIGGITEANMAQTLAAGVAGLSMISMILQSADIQKTVQHINSLY